MTAGAWGDVRRYVTDDCDLASDRDGAHVDGPLELRVQQCGNGDWYVSIARRRGKLGSLVRVTTSGAPRGQRGVASAVANLYRALGGDETSIGPGTTNVPTGAGDFDKVCKGCGEVVTFEHTWAECTASLRSERDRLRDLVVEANDRLEDLEHPPLRFGWFTPKPLLVPRGAVQHLRTAFRVYAEAKEAARIAPLAGALIGLRAVAEARRAEDIIAATNRGGAS